MKHTLLLLIPLSITAAAPSTEALRREITALYGLQGTSVSTTVSMRLPKPGQRGATEEASVAVSAFFDTRKRLRRIRWNVSRTVQPLPEQYCAYYDAAGRLFYSFGSTTEQGTDPGDPARMYTRSWNAYWHNGTPFRSESWRTTLPAGPGSSYSRTRIPFTPGFGTYATTATLLAAVPLRPEAGSRVRFGYMEGMGILINACSVSRRSRPSLSAPRQGLLDAGETILIRKKGPLAHIPGLGRHHWYQVEQPGPDNPPAYWVFGAFIEPLMMTPDMH